MSASASSDGPAAGEGFAGLAPLVSLLAGRRIVALTGAGCSTESGIPDYRGGGRSGPRNPIQHDAFMRRLEVRRRYWARATVGWARFSKAVPNAGHRALAALERTGALAGVITQNVDRLHQRAGSRRVIELHGALEDVACIACGVRAPRQEVQSRLLAANPGWLDRAVEVQPDGDAELDPALVEGFVLVDCGSCGGALKPDVVFFGGTVPERTVAGAFALLEQGEVLLVVGSSLTVYSGYRFVRRALERELPIALVNVGPTRADAVARIKISSPIGEVLPRLAQALGASASG